MSHFQGMPRLQRLEELLSLLASSQAHSVAELAQQLAISERTMARDLKLLVQQGYDIESSSGPGGGVRLSADSHLRALPLRMIEALELLLALTLCEQAGLALFGQISALRSKLSRLFAAQDKPRINTLRKRIRVATPASVAVQARALKLPQSYKQRSNELCQAFFRQQLLNINYRNGSDIVSARVIEPQYLLVSSPFFYLIAWDQGLQEIRTFRHDRVIHAQMLDDHFRLRKADPFWAACMEVGVLV